MAGFNIHVSVAAVVGGVGVTTLMSAGQSDPQTGLLCFFAAMLGGVLPDVDADESIPLNLAFTFGALLGSFFVMFSQVAVYSIVELILIWLVTFLLIKLAVFELFTRLTIHRGIFHSLPAGLFFACATVTLLSRLFHHSAQESWLAGLFILVGYWVHLVLDELYSLNLFGVGGVAHSLGSAFKLYSRNWWVTGAMYGAVVVFYLLTPSLSEMVDGVFVPGTWQGVQARLLPVGAWFGLPFLPVSPGSL